VELAKTFRERLHADPGDLVLLAAIERASRLTALAEDASAKALNRDPGIKLSDVIRMTSAADTALRRLHLDEVVTVKPKPQKPEPAPGTLGAMWRADRERGAA
jgi:hypothetical protein